VVVETDGCSPTLKEADGFDSTLEEVGGTRMSTKSEVKRNPMATCISKKRRGGGGGERCGGGGKPAT
jgi:hypothetical protein